MSHRFESYRFLQMKPQHGNKNTKHAPTKQVRAALRDLLKRYTDMSNLCAIQGLMIELSAMRSKGIIGSYLIGGKSDLVTSIDAFCDFDESKKDWVRIITVERKGGRVV